MYVLWLQIVASEITFCKSVKLNLNLLLVLMTGLVVRIISQPMLCKARKILRLRCVHSVNEDLDGLPGTATGHSNRAVPWAQHRLVHDIPATNPWPQAPWPTNVATMFLSQWANGLDRSNSAFRLLDFEVLCKVYSDCRPSCGHQEQQILVLGRKLFRPGAEAQGLTQTAFELDVVFVGQQVA